MSKMLYQVKYIYSDEMLKKFTRVHLRYRAFHHPLFFRLPAVFCAVALAASLIGNWRTGTARGADFWLIHGLILVTVCFTGYMGFVYPRVFLQKVRDALPQGGKPEIVLRFYDDSFESITGSVMVRHRYEGLYACYKGNSGTYLYVNAVQCVILPASDPNYEAICRLLEDKSKVPLQQIWI